jgi:YVTN family beta-propeller protein
VYFRSNTCRHSEVEQNTQGNNGNNNQVTGFADQSKNTSAPMPKASLIVNRRVRCNFTSGCPAVGQFSITASTNNGSSFSLRGSESGTSLSLTPPFSVTYKVAENNPPLGVVIATMRVGPAPVGIAFNPNNGNMYVANTISNTVSVLDSSTNTVITTIRVGAAPIDIAFNANNGDMYVTYFGATGPGDAVSLIAPITTTSSSGCNGTIDGGQAATCNIVNTFGK